MDLRQQVFAADDIKKEKGVYIAEWGVTFDVWGMTGEQRARVVAAAKDEEGVLDSGKLAAGVIIETTRNPATGELVFSAADRDPLLGRAGVPIDRLATVGLTLSGMTEESQKAMRKNSDAASGAPISDSPKPSE